MMFCILLVLLAGTVTAQSSLEGRRTLCGRELAKAHYMFCYGSETGPKGSLDLKNDVANLEIGVTRIPGRFAYNFQRAMDRVQFENSLVDTCCLKPCHINELLNHC
ncbi:hypothetical protein MSG28_001059 [Choristoneura fumiferana]|uniref:Uncharacterized protein n=1 Tax=Choristoneura fumiferana TaxID=7141 RepID=A0ACC0K3I2_CHOFU|nr:hypothetical protein MSG28_001059 [Choristoneura fumiferana]